MTNSIIPKIVAFTGHRPDRLGGYNTPNAKSIEICDKIFYTLRDIGPSLALSGMALGVDTWAAWICASMGIPFVAVIPFKGQESLWGASDKREYYKLLDLATAIEYVSEPGYAAWKMHKRNEWMVDHCDVIIGVYDGSLGGTHNCLQYAKRKQKEVIIIKP